LDKDGEPLTIGRMSRIIPPALRRAPPARDGGYRFPGCTHKHCIDGHHIINEQTCVTRHDRGGIDRDLAIGALYQ
jgi:hypothetical protein